MERTTNCREKARMKELLFQLDGVIAELTLYHAKDLQESLLSMDMLNKLSMLKDLQWVNGILDTFCTQHPELLKNKDSY